MAPEEHAAVLLSCVVRVHIVLVLSLQTLFLQLLVLPCKNTATYAAGLVPARM